MRHRRFPTTSTANLFKDPNSHSAVFRDLPILCQTATVELPHQIAMFLGARIPSLPFAPEDFLRYHGRARLDSGTAKVPTPAIVAEIHDAIRTKTVEELENTLDNASLPCNCRRIVLLFLAIEPETGNSPLHTALDAQRPEVLLVLNHFRAHTRMPYRKPLYAAYTHQRHNGDSILHSAARSGRLGLVRAIFRLFPSSNFCDISDSVFMSDEVAEEAVPLDGFGRDGDILAMGELSFILKVNGEGRTAAEEARAFGHAALSRWLERAAKFLYRSIRWLDGPQQELDASNLQLWREGIEQFYGLPYRLNASS